MSNDTTELSAGTTTEPRVMTIDEIMQMMPNAVGREFLEAITEADDDEVLVGVAFWSAIRDVLERLVGVTIAADDDEGDDDEDEQ
jgi:hypothetical protein